MTVKELIEQLQALDPDGEKEVVVVGEYEKIFPHGVECWGNEVQIYE